MKIIIYFSSYRSELVNLLAFTSYTHEVFSFRVALQCSVIEMYLLVSLINS